MVDEPSQIWKRMSSEKRAQAAEAFWAEREGVEQQLEAMALIARQHNFRLKFVQALPRGRKVRYLVGLPSVPDGLAARLLVSYHLAYQRPMLGAFLDALGIEHENGLIAKDPEGPIPDDRIRAAASTLSDTFPPDDVALYFATLLTQDPDTWGGLGEFARSSSPA
jgi:hypothetical protein